MQPRVLVNGVDRRLVLLVIALVVVAFAATVSAGLLGSHHGPAVPHAATAIEYGL